MNEARICFGSRTSLTCSTDVSWSGAVETAEFTMVLVPPRLSSQNSQPVWSTLDRECPTDNPWSTTLDQERLIENT
ncbi:hypothetical protein EJB05_55082 [Eragrostis curvula]|uniref:Uncharacterized protein n=1 Tax=Eragrostis curvula TaxID=38414 RepID=A0A5J9SKK4_9POAL|nr:hypothetical protein EJB05_55082 [Eragrostis curvula]